MLILALHSLVVLGAGFLISGASAAPVILLAPPTVSPELATERAVEDAHVDLDQLVLTRLSTLAAAAEPVAFPGLVVLPCANAPADLATLGRQVDAIQGALNYLDYPAAILAADRARATLACLADPLPSAVLPTRLAMLHGVAVAGAGDEAAAQRAFEAAHVLSPATPWDANLPDEARPWFDAAAATVGRASPLAVEILPADNLHRVWVDGRAVASPAPLAIVPGVHWLQVAEPGGLRTFELNVGAGGTLYLPGLLLDVDAEWVADPVLAPHLAALVGPLIGDDAPVVVVLPESTWVGSGGGGWELERRHEDATKRRARTRTVLVASGAAVGVGGGALALASFLGARAAASEAGSASSWAEWSPANATYERHRSGLGIGEAVAGAGAALFTVAIVVPLGPRPERVRTESQSERGRP